MRFFVLPLTAAARQLCSRAAVLVESIDLCTALKEQSRRVYPAVHRINHQRSEAAPRLVLDSGVGVEQMRQNEWLVPAGGSG